MNSRERVLAAVRRQKPVVCLVSSRDEYMSALKRLLSQNRAALANDLLLAGLVMLTTLIIYAKSPVCQSCDTRWTLHIAQSVIQEGDVDLDEYVEQGLILSNDYRVVQIGEHFYSYFPLGTPLLAVLPLALYRVASSVLGLGVGELSQVFEMLVASSIVSICAAVIYGMGRLFLDRLWSCFLACVFAFCTSAWSTASRALWQHGPSMLMLSLTLYLMLLAEKRPRWIALSGLPLACAYVIRPTNSISVVCLSIFVLIRHKKRILGFLGVAMLVAIPFLALNSAIYRSILPPYFLPGRIGTNTAFWEAIAANLVSPARGLFVYSPVFLASVAGVLLKVRGKELGKLDVALLAVLVLHLVAVSSFKHWWGGHSFGPRFFSDMVPYLTYWAGVAVAELLRPAGRARFAYAVCFALLAVASAFAHGRGATSSLTFDWNREPVNVDWEPSRNWDWRDAQLLRGFLPKIEVRPERAYVVRHIQDRDEHLIKVELVDISRKSFHWRAIAPAGITLSPIEGAGAVRYSLLVTVPETSHSLGQHSLGTIRIQTAPDGLLGRPKAFVVPVELRIVEGDHKAFLPLALRESTRDR